MNLDDKKDRVVVERVGFSSDIDDQIPTIPKGTVLCVDREDVQEAILSKGGVTVHKKSHWWDTSRDQATEAFNHLRHLYDVLNALPKPSSEDQGSAPNHLLELQYLRRTEPSDGATARLLSTDLRNGLSSIESVVSLLRSSREDLASAHHCRRSEDDGVSVLCAGGRWRAVPSNRHVPRVKWPGRYSVDVGFETQGSRVNESRTAEVCLVGGREGGQLVASSALFFAAFGGVLRERPRKEELRAAGGERVEAMLVRTQGLALLFEAFALVTHFSRMQSQLFSVLAVREREVCLQLTCGPQLVISVPDVSLSSSSSSSSSAASSYYLCVSASGVGSERLDRHRLQALSLLIHSAVRARQRRSLTLTLVPGISSAAGPSRMASLPLDPISIIASLCTHWLMRDRFLAFFREKGVWPLWEPVSQPFSSAAVVRLAGDRTLRCVVGVTMVYVEPCWPTSVCPDHHPEHRAREIIEQLLF